MKYPYIIIDDNERSALETRAALQRFPDYIHVASAYNSEDGLNAILEYNPPIIFLEIDPVDGSSDLSTNLISEMYRFLRQVPKVVIVTNSREKAFEAITYEVFDYLVKPVTISDLRKCLMKFEKQHREQSITKVELSNGIEHSNPIPEHDVRGDLESDPDDSELSLENDSADEIDTAKSDNIAEQSSSVATEKPLIVCVKSYGDYRFIEAKNICYLKADNNSTDIHLRNGEMITAFKTLKHFEGLLKLPFIRIHNSYIVNIDYVSRIHTGNSVCYIKDTTIKLPFSKSYKENIDSVINSIILGNYIEI